MPHRKAAKFVWRNLAVIALLLAAAATWYGYRINTRRVDDNLHRVSDIQQARVDSCKRTYEAFRQVFKPFAQHSPPGDVRKFNHRIDALKAGCGVQTGVTDKPTR